MKKEIVMHFDEMSKYGFKVLASGIQPMSMRCKILEHHVENGVTIIDKFEPVSVAPIPSFQEYAIKDFVNRGIKAGLDADEITEQYFNPQPIKKWMDR